MHHLWKTLARYVLSHVTSRKEAKVRLRPSPLVSARDSSCFRGVRCGDGRGEVRGERMPQIQVLGTHDYQSSHLANIAVQDRQYLVKSKAYLQLSPTRNELSFDLAHYRQASGMICTLKPGGRDKAAHGEGPTRWEAGQSCFLRLVVRWDRDAIGRSNASSDLQHRSSFEMQHEKTTRRIAVRAATWESGRSRVSAI